ncbi:MAG: helix-turn-helix domain-containing protein [Lentisphaeria bacterium]|nr:helix-turn-helix domain-containing protein [Lentisphaeria bacterium]
MNNTLHNGLKILEFLATGAEALSIKEIAEYFQLPNSHVCRLLKSLTEIGYAEQIPGNRKYRISLKILNLANARLKKENLLRLARPYLHQLAEKLNTAVFVTRVYCGYSLIIGAEYPAFFTEAQDMVVGTLHSPTSSACGKVCAAYSTEEVRQTLLNEIDWEQTGDYQGRRKEFEDELVNIRQRGCALRDVGGVGAVGVPLFEENGILSGALGVMLPKERSRTAELWQAVIESTVSCGKLISIAQGASLEEYPNYNISARRKK